MLCLTAAIQFKFPVIRCLKDPEMGCEHCNSHFIGSSMQSNSDPTSTKISLLIWKIEIGQKPNVGTVHIMLSTRSHDESYCRERSKLVGVVCTIFLESRIFHYLFYVRCLEQSYLAVFYGVGSPKIPSKSLNCTFKM